AAGICRFPSGNTMTTYGFLGDLLVRNSLVDAAALSQAIEAQGKSGVTLARALAELGLADESALTAKIAAAMRMESLDGGTPAADALALLPKEFCVKRRVLPISFDGKRMRLAVIDPADYASVQDAEFRSGKKAIAVLVTQTWLERAMTEAYPEPAPVS